MKRMITIVLIISSIVFWGSGIALAEEKKKSNWYIGFGIGLGALQLEGESLDDYYDDDPDADVGGEVTLNFGVGAIIKEKFHLGFDGSTVRQEVDFDIGDAAYQVNNYYAALSYYPWTKGFFIKAGAGWSILVYEYDRPADDDIDRFGGFGYLVGLGYDFWLGKTFNLGIHAEYSRQSYSDSDAPDDTEFSSVYLSFYWF